MRPTIFEEMKKKKSSRECEFDRICKRICHFNIHGDKSLSILCKSKKFKGNITEGK